MKVGDAFVGNFEPSDGMIHVVEQGSVRFFFLDNPVENLGQEQGFGVLYRVLMELHRRKGGPGFAYALNLSVVQMFHFHVKDGKRHQESMRNLCFLTVRVRHHVSNTSEFFRVHSDDHVLVVVRKSV